jgi:hypothetical protein
VRADAQQVLTRRALWVVVSRAQYDLAIEVHREGWQLQVTGNLVSSQGRLEMRPDRFEVIRG